MNAIAPASCGTAALRWATWGLACGLVWTATNSAAQPTSGASAEAAAPTAESQPAQSRSLFLATIANLIAQNVGNGVGTALSAGLSGSITRWFNPEPTAAGASKPALEPQKPQAKTKKAVTSKAMATELHAGIAYEVHRIDAQGVAKAVNPARHTFRTGDRFQVFYRPSLPGRVKVININPEGRTSRIDTVNVAAGELVALGPYQFADAQGEEILKLVLEPCSTPALAASTRSIVKSAAVAPNEPAGLRIRDCADATTATPQAATRSIRKTTLDGSTAYALDRVSKEELRSGLVGARSVQIRLKHRAARST